MGLVIDSYLLTPLRLISIMLNWTESGLGIPGTVEDENNGSY